MNRTLKDATVKRYHYETHDELRTHLDHLVQAYNCARRLKTLKGLTPSAARARFADQHTIAQWCPEPAHTKMALPERV